MTIPPIGAIGAALPQNSLAGLSPSETPGIGAGPEQTSGTGPSSGVGGVGGISGSENPTATNGVEGTSGTESGGFGGALTQAISSLDQTQQSAAGAAQALATGTASNPESAVVTVEDAQLAMQLASQIRTKAVEAAQQIFQTQV